MNLSQTESSLHHRAGPLGGGSPFRQKGPTEGDAVFGIADRGFSARHVFNRLSAVLIFVLHRTGCGVFCFDADTLPTCL